MQVTTTLRCSLSGLPVGSLSVMTTAGALPYIAQWDRLVVRHPVFSLSDYKLFEFTKKEWARLAKKVADEEVTKAESDILCVSYLAVLHTFGKIYQDRPILPPLPVVQTTLSRVLALAYWKYHLESPRFRFPEYNLAKENGNIDLDNIQYYLDACFEAKDNYESKVNTLEEESKVRAAKAAMDALTREWVGPVSRKVLWSWVKHYLPDKQYAADKVGWMHTLFLGGGNAIIEFQEEDIQYLEDAILGECPAGTGVMKAVRDRISQIWSIWKAHHEAFAIDLEDYAVNQGVLVNGKQVAMPDPGPIPQAKDYNGNRTKFIIAEAKWKIAKAAWDAQNAKSADPQVNTQLGEL